MELSKTSTFEVELAVSDTFYLFTPIGEKNWAKGFDPMFFVEDTAPKRGRAFSTDHGESTLWLITDYDPEHHSIAYARFTPGKDLALITVDVAAVSESRTNVAVTYDYTSLSETGDEYVKSMDESYDEYIGHWKEAIDELVASKN